MFNVKKYIIIIIIISVLMTNVFGLYPSVVYATTEESTKVEYYIHDNYIERVLPNTDIETFKNTLGEIVVIYEDETKEKEVTTRINKNRNDCK